MTPDRKRLIILGSGFASFSVLKGLEANIYEIIVISPRNHFLFTPLLPSTTVGTVEFRSIIEPIRSVKASLNFHLAQCVSLDPVAQVIQCEDSLEGRRFSLRYDLLVIGVGVVSSTYNIPGANEFGMPLKELADARSIRRKIIENFERASIPTVSDDERRRLLHFVVVGGGPTGVEFAAELHDFLTEDLIRDYPSLISGVSVTLLEAGEKILGTFDSALRKYTMRLFFRQRISVRTQTPVEQVEHDHLFLKDGSVVPYGMLVWSAGNVQTPLIESLPFEKDHSSRIVTDEQFHVKGYSNIFALGDCATIQGHSLPATSQVAQQEGRYLAGMLNRLARGKSVKDFTYHHHGMLAYIGSNRALADLPQVKVKGFSTWVFWRSAYVTKLVSLRNKILVLFDWAKTLLFGRDTSTF